MEWSVSNAEFTRLQQPRGWLTC